MGQQQTDGVKKSSRRLWIVEMDGSQAHVYERTSKGTKWIHDADLCDGGLDRFADWLADSKHKNDAFDKAVVVGTEGDLVDIRPALGRRLDSCVKLAEDKTMVKNASEDRLAGMMWF